MFILHLASAMFIFAIGIGVLIVNPIRASINKEPMTIIDIFGTLFLAVLMFFSSAYQIHLLYLLIQKGS